MYNLNNSSINSNASIVATSTDETIFLSSTGDVLVCRDFHADDDRTAPLGHKFCEDEDHGNSDEWKRSPQNNFIPPDAVSEVAKKLWEEEEGRHTCCDLNDFRTQGLCGGAEDDGGVLRSCDSDVSYGVIDISTTNSTDEQQHLKKIVDASKVARRKRMKSRNSPNATSSPTSNNAINLANGYTQLDRSRAECEIRRTKSTQSGTYHRIIVTSKSDGEVRKPLSINTSSSSIDDEEYDDLDINGIKLGNHGQLLTRGSSSPTPVMSFDYSCYEPPTPEPVSHEDSLNDREERHVSIPNLEGVRQRESIDLPTGLNRKPVNELLQPHQIRTRAKSMSHDDNHHSMPKPIVYPSGLPGIPTFMSHLSQIRIVRVSAHHRGRHVLLMSDEGLLFSYGSNDRGQLGIGKQTSKSNTPQLLTPLLENGGKTVNCAAGIDYSLVVVRTEGSRIAHRRRQQQHVQNLHDSNGIRTNTNECNAHHQMYGFGCNDNMKIGLLDPDKAISRNFGSESPRRRCQSSGGDSIQSDGFVSSPGSFGDVSSAGGSSTASTDVFLPRRVALHCKVIPRKTFHDDPTQSLPYGIFSVAASIHHSAALVRRPSGSVELYTWGRGEEGALGLPFPRVTEDTFSTAHLWETLCCATDQDDETINTLSGLPPNQTETRIVVSAPTMVNSLSTIIVSEKTFHPPLPKRNQPNKKNNPPPRSPRKNHPKTSPIFKLSEVKPILQESEYLVTLALGPNCTHVITSTGRWLVFGSSSDELLALGSGVCNAFQPIEVKLPFVPDNFDKTTPTMSYDPRDAVASISIGEYHGVVLTKTGRAFTWGISAHGALGHSNIPTVPTPRPVLFDEVSRRRLIPLELHEKISHHIRGEAIIDSKPFGDNRTRTRDIHDVDRVAYVHAGQDMSVFILKSGHVLTCGRKSGRLGQGDVSTDVQTPSRLFGGMQLWLTD